MATRPRYYILRIPPPIQIIQILHYAIHAYQAEAARRGSPACVSSPAATLQSPSCHRNTSDNCRHQRMIRLAPNVFLLQHTAPPPPAQRASPIPLGVRGHAHGRVAAGGCRQDRLHLCARRSAGHGSDRAPPSNSCALHGLSVLKRGRRGRGCFVFQLNAHYPSG